MSDAKPPAQVGRDREGRRLDASMDLLNEIIRQPLDPDYARVAAEGPPSPKKARWALVVVAILIGVMFTVSALQTTKAAPANANERKELIARIRTAETEQDQLRSRSGTLQAEIAQLRAKALGAGSAARELEGQIDELEPMVGVAAVKGPGVTIVVDDGPDATNNKARVADVDLQILVNGLWMSGAEAVAINGHRISTLTAIRGAGDAITVDYRSLTRPYKIEAIGDSKTLQARYVESSGGSWWNLLEQTYKMRHEINSAEELTLQSDPGMVLRYAVKGER